MTPIKSKDCTPGQLCTRHKWAGTYHRLYHERHQHTSLGQDRMFEADHSIYPDDSNVPGIRCWPYMVIAIVSTDDGMEQDRFVMTPDGFGWIYAEKDDAQVVVRAEPF